MPTFWSQGTSSTSTREVRETPASHLHFPPTPFPVSLSLQAPSIRHRTLHFSIFPSTTVFLVLAAPSLLSPSFPPLVAQIKSPQTVGLSPAWRSPRTKAC